MHDESTSVRAASQFTQNGATAEKALEDRRELPILRDKNRRLQLVVRELRDCLASDSQQKRLSTRTFSQARPSSDRTESIRFLLDGSEFPPESELHLFLRSADWERLLQCFLDCGDRELIRLLSDHYSTVGCRISRQYDRLQYLGAGCVRELPHQVAVLQSPVVVESDTASSGRVLRLQSQLSALTEQLSDRDRTIESLRSTLRRAADEEVSRLGETRSLLIKKQSTIHHLQQNLSLAAAHVHWCQRYHTQRPFEPKANFQSPLDASQAACCGEASLITSISAPPPRIPPEHIVSDSGVPSTASLSSLLDAVESSQAMLKQLREGVQRLQLRKQSLQRDIQNLTRSKQRLKDESKDSRPADDSASTRKMLSSRSSSSGSNRQYQARVTGISTDALELTSSVSKRFRSSRSPRRCRGTEIEDKTHSPAARGAVISSAAFSRPKGYRTTGKSQRSISTHPSRPSKSPILQSPILSAEEAVPSQVFDSVIANRIVSRNLMEQLQVAAETDRGTVSVQSAATASASAAGRRQTPTASTLSPPTPFSASVSLKNEASPVRGTLPLPNPENRRSLIVCLHPVLCFAATPPSPAQAVASLPTRNGSSLASACLVGASIEAQPKRDPISLVLHPNRTPQGNPTSKNGAALSQKSPNTSIMKSKSVIERRSQRHVDSPFIAPNRRPKDLSNARRLNPSEVLSSDGRAASSGAPLLVSFTRSPSDRKQTSLASHASSIREQHSQAQPLAGTPSAKLSAAELSLQLTPQLSAAPESCKRAKNQVSTGALPDPSRSLSSTRTTKSNTTRMPRKLIRVSPVLPRSVVPSRNLILFSFSLDAPPSPSVLASVDPGVSSSSEATFRSLFVTLSEYFSSTSCFLRALEIHVHSLLETLRPALQNHILLQPVSEIVSQIALHSCLSQFVHSQIMSSIAVAKSSDQIRLLV